MADNFNPADNLSKEDQIKGGKMSHGGGRSKSANAGGSTTSGRGSKEGQIKGGKSSNDNQYTV